MTRACLDCGALSPRSRCIDCSRAQERLRNASPKRAGYRDPRYLSQPKTGICHICGLPGADTRDHLVPLAVDPQSIHTLPAHRACNSGRGAQVRG